MRDATLVIGAAGFLGRHIACGLNRAGLPVVGLASREPEGALFERFHIGRSELVGSLTDALQGCTNVVFAGGVTRPGSPMASIRAEIAIEALHVIEVAEFCAAHGVQRFLLLSSGGTIYGRTEVSPIPETHPTNPVSSYGLGKLVAEHGLRLVSHRSGMRGIALRIANPYGPGQTVKGNQGFVAAVVNAARSGAPLEIWGDGSIVRDFVYVDDVARAAVCALTADIPSGAINIGSGSSTSLREVVTLAEQALGRSIAVRHLPGREVDLPRVELDIARARSLLAWQPELSLPAGLARTVLKEGLGP